MKGKIKAVRLEGTSMAPLFTEGEVAFVRSAAPADAAAGPFSRAFGLSAGDCAVYNYRDRVLLHRVIKTEAKGAWFSDDAGRLRRHFIPWSAIRGKVISDNPLKNGRPGLAYSKLKRLARILFPLLAKGERGGFEYKI